jgi:hypothetical protein
MVVFFNRERAERFLMAELPNGRPFFPRGTIRGLRPQRFRRLLEAYPESNERLDSLLMEPSPIPTWASDSDEELQGDLVPIDLAIEGLDELIKKGYT